MTLPRTCLALTLTLAAASCVATTGAGPSPRTRAAPGADAGPRTDRHGDPLPQGALARLGTARLRFETHCAAFSPDGNVLACGGSNEIHLVEAGTGKWLRRFRAGRFPLRGLAFTPDGKTLIAGHPDAFHLRDPATGDFLGAWELGRGPTAPFVLSRDGRVLAAGTAPDGETVRLWKLPGPEPLHTFRGWGNRHLLALAPDGATLAMDVPGRRVCVRDVASGRKLWELPGACCFLAFSPDGKVLTDGRHLWEAGTGKLRLRLEPEDEKVVAGAFAEGGKTLALALCDGSLQLWDPVTGRCRSSVPGQGRFSQEAAFSADGRRLATWGGGELRLWDVLAGRRLNWFERCGGPLAFSPDGKLLATAGGDWEGDCALLVHDWAAGRRKATLRGDVGQHDYAIRAVAFSPDGKALASGGDDATARVWDLAAGTLRHSFGHSHEVSLTAFAAGGRFLLYASRGHVRFKDVGSGKDVDPLPDFPLGGGQVVFAPGAEHLASATIPTQLWHVPSGKMVGECSVGGRWAISPDGRLAAAVHDWGDDDDPDVGGELSVHRLPGGEPLRQFGKQQGRVDPVAFSPDGKTLATAHRAGGVCLWEVATGVLRHKFPAGHGEVRHLAFAPDGKVLASAADTVLVWDVLAPGRQAAPLQPGELEGLWAALAGDDVPGAYRAVCRLAASPELGVPHLRDRLRAVPATDPRQIDRLVRDLGEANYRVRARASRELKLHGEAAAAAMSRALEGQPPLELRRRLEGLLNRLKSGALSPEALRAWRAVEVLEIYGSAEARELLRTLARGQPEAGLTREAHAALQRLARRPATAP